MDDDLMKNGQYCFDQLPNMRKFLVNLIFLLLVLTQNTLQKLINPNFFINLVHIVFIIFKETEGQIFLYKAIRNTLSSLSSAESL